MINHHSLVSTEVAEVTKVAEVSEVAQAVILLPQRAFITAALPYVSGAKHLGNAVGSILPADVHARFRRLLGHDVAFICGTDEHGSPAELAALAAGQSTPQYCTQAHEAQASEWAGLGVAFDHFGRTSSPACIAEAQAEFLELHRRGFLQETSRVVPWGESSQRFLPDRLVRGICPRCGAAAKGDGCDGCGAALEAADLISPTSVLVPGEQVVLRQSRHLALDLPRLQQAIEADIASKPYSAFVRAESSNWLGDLKQRDITRDTAWGVPVPLPGWDGKSLYVWFDAPVAYWGLLREWAALHNRDAGDFLGVGEQSDWTAFLAKDNVCFHSVWFPAIALGGRNLPTPGRISGHGWLLCGESKFSTSAGSGLSVAQAVAKYPADALRWWLCANAPEDGADRAWDEEVFIQNCNSVLSGKFGNLISRIGAVAESLGGPFEVLSTGVEAETLLVGVGTCVDEAAIALANLSTRRACQALERGWGLCNAYLAEVAPWATAKTNPELARQQIRTVVAAVSWVTRASLPIVPGLAGRALLALGDDHRAGTWPGVTPQDSIRSTHAVSPHRIPPLVPRLTLS